MSYQDRNLLANTKAARFLVRNRLQKRSGDVRIFNKKGAQQEEENHNGNK